MARGKLLAGLLASALFLGCLSPVETVMAAENEMEMEIETEVHGVSEDEEDKDESLKATEADANGFVIDEDGVLTGYTGSGGVVTIPDGVTSIGEGAFEGCHFLTGIIIPESVTSIGRYAFRGCSSLTSITIPGSVTSIDDYVFESDGLTIINVETDNANYSSEDGILYNKEKSTLIFCPRGKSGDITIPNGVACIGYGAFWGSSLTSITIPESVTSIGRNAFYKSSLTSITIPNSVTSIGDNAFFCDELTAINVAADNVNYSSENGILYDKGKSILIVCPREKSGNITVNFLSDFSLKDTSLEEKR